MADVVHESLLALITRRVLGVEKAIGRVSKQQGPQGPQGERGFQGEQGVTGAVGEQGPVGPQGEQGPQGERGPQGEQGPQGERGPQGEQGPIGPQGEQGEKGEDGLAGEQGPIGPIPRHEWVGTRLRFEKPDGKWGKLVELKGEKGADGKDHGTVIVARGGSGGTDLDALAPGAAGIEPAGIAVLQNGQWTNLPWSAFLGVIAGAVDMGAKLSRRTDFVGASLMYRGEAVPGSSEAAPVWSIRRVEFAVDGDVTETWAGGTADFVNAWDDRATLIYS